jgi:hypothetical protein
MAREADESDVRERWRRMAKRNRSSYLACWVQALPGAERVRQSYPTVTSIAVMLAVAGLELIDTVEVSETNPNWTSASQAAAWVRMMRNADSVLLSFSDEEIAVGLDRLESYSQDHVLSQLRGGLAVFRLVA